MRSASTQLKARIAVDATTLCRLWTVTRSDGLVLRFTDAVRPVTIDVADGTGSNTFRSDLSFTASAILASRTNANLQSYTMTAVMDDAGFKEEDIRQRLFDGAVSTVYVCDYDNPSFGAVNMFAGVFGQIQLSDQKAVQITVVPASSVTAGTIIGLDKYSQTCRASLGDSKCGIDIGALSVDFTVGSASGGSVVSTAFTQASGAWGLGFIKWLTGTNAGTTSSVQSNDVASTSVFLTSPPAAPIEAGDTGTIFPGCDKTRATCKAKFNNVVNFRGEPDVPTGAGVPGSNFNNGLDFAVGA